jgi:hypothetical protein
MWAFALEPALRLVRGLFRFPGAWLLTIPSCEPPQFVAGDTVQWTKSLADFVPSDGWTLKYRFTNAVAGGEIAAANVTCAPNASGYWDVTVSAANSLVAAGVWRLIGWVSNVAGERHVIFDEEMTILADATSVSPTGLQTPNERILIAIAARLEGRVTADQEQVQINGTAITRIPIEKLSALRGIYEGKVWREQNPTRSYPVHKMRFTHAR